MTDDEYMARVEGMERRLYRIARAVLWNDSDCADAIQEAVVKGWLKRGSLRNPDWFETWLIRILINECRNIQRKNRVKLLPLDDQIDFGEPSAANDPVEDVQLRDALSRLPSKYRTVLVLHHLEGFSLEETADLLNQPQTTVKSRLHQARRALRALLSTGDDFSEDA